MNEHAEVMLEQVEACLELFEAGVKLLAGARVFGKNTRATVETEALNGVFEACGRVKEVWGW